MCGSVGVSADGSWRRRAECWVGVILVWVKIHGYIALCTPVLWVRNDFSPDPDPTFQVVLDPNPDPDPDPDLTASGQLGNLQILCVNNGTMQQEF